MPRAERNAVARIIPRGRGFTLVELMVVLAIVAVLMTIALPAYNKSLQKGRRSDAIAALLTVAARQEQYMLHRQRYSDDLLTLGFSSDPLLSEQGYYSIRTQPCEESDISSCYLLTAFPVEGTSQALDAACESFLLDSLGQRSATGTQSHRCW